MKENWGHDNKNNIMGRRSFMFNVGVIFISPTLFIHSDCIICLRWYQKDPQSAPWQLTLKTPTSCWADSQAGQGTDSHDGFSQITVHSKNIKIDGVQSDLWIWLCSLMTGIKTWTFRVTGPAIQGRPAPLPPTLFTDWSSMIILLQPSGCVSGAADPPHTR